MAAAFGRLMQGYDKQPLSAKNVSCDNRSYVGGDGRVAMAAGGHHTFLNAGRPQHG